MIHDCIYKMNHKGIQEWKLNCCQIWNSCQPQKVKDNQGDSQTSSSIKFALNIKWLQTVSQRSLWCELVGEGDALCPYGRWGFDTWDPLGPSQKLRQGLSFPSQAMTSWKHGPEEALLAHDLTFLCLLPTSVVCIDHVPTTCLPNS